MKILVLVKAVPNTSGGYEDGERKTNTLIANPADLTALEEALRLRDSVGGIVTVITMGVIACESILRQTIACGANEAVLVTDAAFAGSDTAATSRILARAVEFLGGFDLIFCGRRSTDGETGQVGPELAGRLNMNCVTSCTQFQLEDNRLRCHCMTAEGSVEYGLVMPAVVTFCNGINSPRLPSLMGLSRAKRAEIKMLGRADLSLSPEECGQKGSPTVVKKSERKPFEKRKVTICSVQEGVDRILDAVKEVSHG